VRRTSTLPSCSPWVPRRSLGLHSSYRVAFYRDVEPSSWLLKVLDYLVIKHPMSASAVSAGALTTVGSIALYPCVSTRVAGTALRPHIVQAAGEIIVAVGKWEWARA